MKDGTAKTSASDDGLALQPYSDPVVIRTLRTTRIAKVKVAKGNFSCSGCAVLNLNRAMHQTICLSSLKRHVRDVILFPEQEPLKMRRRRTDSSPRLPLSPPSLCNATKLGRSLFFLLLRQSTERVVEKSNDHFIGLRPRCNFERMPENSEPLLAERFIGNVRETSP